jgi:hypothetical protein
MKSASLFTAALAAATAMGGTPNLLSNPSFETPGNPFLEEIFESWEGFGNVFPDPDDMGNSEVTAFDGLVSAKMFGGFTGAQSDQGLFQILSIPDAAGKTYRASVSVLSPSADPINSSGHLPLLLMQFRDAAGEQISQPEVTVFDATNDNTDEWVTRSVEGIAPAGTEEINVFCLFIQFGDDPGSLFWDAVSLEEVPEGPDCTGLDDPNKVVEDSTAPYEGFMNVFNLDGTYAFGSAWGIPDLTATFDDGASTVEMKPVGIDTADEFWYAFGVGGPGAIGNKEMEANLFQSTGACLAGQTVTFSGTVESNTFTEDYLAEIWIKDFTGDFQSFEEVRIPATPGPFSISLDTIDDPSRVVQWGFSVLGPNVWPTDVDLFGSVVYTTVSSNPGCNAADIAMPYGVLDLADINAFVSGFLAGDPIADLDPDGIFDLNDITAFVGAFTAGCP